MPTDLGSQQSNTEQSHAKESPYKGPPTCQIPPPQAAPTESYQKERRRCTARTRLRYPRVRQLTSCYSASVEPIPPTGWSSAMLEDPVKWKKAADAEIQMLEHLGTWEKVDLPPGRQTISTKWVFKRKWDGQGCSIYKTRLVAKGFVQQPDRDYGDTYAPVSSIVTLRCLLSVAAARDYDIWQVDIKNAFLHGAIDRELYIQQPEGYRDGTDKVLKLRKALYGLK